MQIFEAVWRKRRGMLQVDEPYLVMDLTMGDVALFRKLYQTLLEQKAQ